MSSKKCFFTEIDSTFNFSDKSINRIKIAIIDGNQCIVGIDAKKGQTGILFYPDAVLSTDFILNEELSEKSFNKGRVRVSKFKKEWSECFFLPKTKEEVDLLFKGNFEIGDFLPEGDVYKNYVLPISKKSIPNKSSVGFSPKSYLSFPKHFDTEQVRSSLPEIKKLYNEGWTASVTQKVHGTCLYGKTKVKMANGKSKKIKHIKTGDIVLGKDGPTSVLDSFSYPNIDNWMKIVIQGDHLHTLICTNDHLILTPNGYTSAFCLKNEDLVLLKDHKIGSIISIVNYNIESKKDKRRYDITTESSNFIAEGVIVHNSARSGYVKIPFSPNLFESFTEGLLSYLYKFSKVFKSKPFTNKTKEMYHDYSLKIKSKYINTLSDRYDYVNGSRNVIFDNYSDNTDSGYHSNNFRKTSFDVFKKYLEKDVVVFYEIIGYEDLNRPIMIPNNGVDYSYGIGNGDFGIQVYRITIDGKDLPVEDMEAYSLNKLGVSHVPRMSDFFNVKRKSFENLISELSKLFEDSSILNSIISYKDFKKQDTTNYTHINEGIVLRLDDPQNIEPPKFFKLKRPEFYAAEGLIKSSEAAKISIEQE